MVLFIIPLLKVQSVKKDVVLDGLYKILQNLMAQNFLGEQNIARTISRHKWTDF